VREVDDVPVWIFRVGQAVVRGNVVRTHRGGEAITWLECPDAVDGNVTVKEIERDNL